MRTISLLLLFVIIAYSCSKKTAPVKSEPPIVATPPPADTLKMTPEATPAPDAMVTTGKGLFDAKCGKCHVYKQPELFTAERWTRIMERMAPKAKLTEDEKTSVVAYVHYYAKKS